MTSLAAIGVILAVLLAGAVIGVANEDPRERERRQFAARDHLQTLQNNERLRRRRKAERILDENP